MSQRLIAFLSSTVEDLDGVRVELRGRLEARGIEVRTSEHPDFPVEPGVSSHDACLRAVRASHVFVLLVAGRFGGEYQGQNKSITWREWEEAMDAGLLPVVLVERRTNELARQIFRRRAALEAAHPDEQVIQIDRRLRAEPDFADLKPHRHNLPGVQRFIDALRKGHVDNWMHGDWDGTADEALARVDARLSTALAVALSRQQHLRDLLSRDRLRADALHQVMLSGANLAIAARAEEGSTPRALALWLELLAEHRKPLFDYRDADEHNFVVYLREGDALTPYARHSHHAIPTHGRRWRVGQGHVGLAVQQGRLLVSGDIRHTEAWVPSEARQTDGAHYVSAVSVPFWLRAPTEAADGVLIVTSNRLDHFRSPHQIDVLTIGTLVNTLVMILA